MKLKVSITTEDGELLDQFIVDNESGPREASLAQWQVNGAQFSMAGDVRRCIERTFGTKDMP